jgi:hypothetical protein
LDGGNPPATITYCNLNGASGGTLLAANPQFFLNPWAGDDSVWATADDDYGDLRISCTSPLADAGDNAAVPSEITTDIQGQPLRPRRLGRLPVGIYRINALDQVESNWFGHSQAGAP